MQRFICGFMPISAHRTQGILSLVAVSLLLITQGRRSKPGQTLHPLPNNPLTQQHSHEGRHSAPRDPWNEKMSLVTHMPSSIGPQTHSVSKETWQSCGATMKVESTLLALGCLCWEWGSTVFVLKMWD